MDRRCFAILYHLLRTVAGLTLTEVVDVEEMVAMFLHIVVHDVKNRVIQRKFMRSGPAADSRILRDAISRPNGLKVPKDDILWHYTYECNFAINSCDILIVQCDHKKWRGTENAPSTSKEFFNMKHSSARNVIKREFGVLKGRWTILRGKSYYPVEVQCRTILACCLLHNLINREMTNFDIEDNIDEVDSTHSTTAADDIHYIETSNEWTQWRDDLAEEMFTDWELHNQ
ncbi:uncharacterized protein LOC127148662 [Cucumis melo]|uniref:Uncharacterized protein LOC127148662 n=1 Tax=Cucumis melo TaxID=3656 RepID=A0ABM3KM00_CUCME|nr:uncharacterized protein LOC127148662 [Cucumis melo]